MLKDTSSSDGLERCLASISVLWSTEDVSLFVRNPAKGTLSVFSLSELGKLAVKNESTAGANVEALLVNANRADSHIDKSKNLFYLRQNRSGQPNAVLRVGLDDANRPDENVVDATRAILMAATAFHETYSYFTKIKEPFISEGLRKDINDYLAPISESISFRSLLPLVGFVHINSSDEYRVNHCRLVSNNTMRVLQQGSPALNVIVTNIQMLPFEKELQRLPRSNLGRLGAIEKPITGVSDILVFKMRLSSFSGAVFFGAPDGYSLTELDHGLMKLACDQYFNYGIVYNVFNEERHKLIEQQQEFGVAYAVDFTQAARHAARDNLTVISDNVEYLKEEATEDKDDVTDILDAYNEVKTALADIDLAYTTIQSLVGEESEPEPIDLVSLIDDMISTFHAKFDELGITVSSSVGKETIRIHEQTVRVALFNLFQNACNAFEQNDIPKKRRKIDIYIGGRKKQPLIIEDTAGGIKELFDRNGKKVEEPSLAWSKGVSGSGGTGFGMHLIKRYLSANNCQISFGQTKRGLRFEIDISNIRVRKK